jgi:hypothetical protein
MSLKTKIKNNGVNIFVWILIVMVTTASVVGFIFVAKPLGITSSNNNLKATGNSVTVIIVSNGSINQVASMALFLDPALTQPATTINWGSLNPGGSTTVTIYVKNTGNIPLTLSKAETAWSPTTTSSYIALSWNRDGTVLQPGASISSSLNLVISSSIVGITNYSFNVNIIGTG